MAYSTFGVAAPAAGDAAAALDASETAWQHVSFLPQAAATGRAYGAQAALAGGGLLAARRWTDDAVMTTTGFG